MFVCMHAYVCEYIVQKFNICRAKITMLIIHF